MNTNDLINGYFEGSLTSSELDELEGLRQSDPDFDADFKFQRELRRSLKKSERQEIKAMFSELKVEQKIEPKLVKMRPWLVAASIALLAGLASWFFFNTNTIDTDKLYASNFVPYENVVSPIERGNQIEDLKTRAFAAYENKEYQKALNLFTELRLQGGDAYVDFYKGIVQMELNQHEKAIEILDGYIRNEGQLSDRATWYLALAYLKIGEISECKIQLTKLIAMNSFKTESAQKLLVQLD